MITASSLSQKLKALRKERDVPAMEVAVAVGISRSYLSGMETGRDKPGRDTLLALATYYGVSVDWLAANQGEPEDPRAKSAQNEDEALLLWAFRALPQVEAKAHLNLLLSRIRKKAS